MTIIGKMYNIIPNKMVAINDIKVVPMLIPSAVTRPFGSFAWMMSFMLLILFGLNTVISSVEYVL
jgi:hypothetical protein